MKKRKKISEKIFNKKEDLVLFFIEGIAKDKVLTVSAKYHPQGIDIIHLTS